MVGGFILTISDGLWNPSCQPWKTPQGGRIIVPTSSMEKLVGAQPPANCSFSPYLVGKMGTCGSFAHHWVAPTRQPPLEARDTPSNFQNLAVLDWLFLPHHLPPRGHKAVAFVLTTPGAGWRRMVASKSQIMYVLYIYIYIYSVYIYISPSNWPCFFKQIWNQPQEVMNSEHWRKQRKIV